MLLYIHSNIGINISTLVKQLKIMWTIKHYVRNKSLTYLRYYCTSNKPIKSYILYLCKIIYFTVCIHLLSRIFRCTIENSTESVERENGDEL